LGFFDSAGGGNGGGASAGGFGASAGGLEAGASLSLPTPAGSFSISETGSTLNLRALGIMGFLLIILQTLIYFAELRRVSQ
jgi:hypothetical protein